ncbi:glycosyltransferase [Ligilactobacillus equi]
MNIGLFTDTYFPQVSGVATSIRTAKEELEKLGHKVIIFTTTDKGVDVEEDEDIVRLPSIPFFAFTDRRIAFAGASEALEIAREHNLDIIHTQTEFSLGLMGISIANKLKIPVVHTYHTQYEDYTRYIANGLLIRPSMVKYIVRGFLSDVDGVICPSGIVKNILQGYQVKPPMRVISTGIELEKFQTRFTAAEIQAKRQELGIANDETMLLSLSRISYEKNIQAVIQALPQALAVNPKIKLVVVGDGPYRKRLEDLVRENGIEENVVFTGMVPSDQTVLYYQAADFFISASTSETQGLTYLEAIASQTPVIAQSNAYLDDVISDPMFGYLYADEGDLAEEILTAVSQTPTMTADAYQAKCFEISATHFGQELEKYYGELIAHNNFRLANYGGEKSFPKALTYLPKRVFKYLTKRNSSHNMHDEQITPSRSELSLGMKEPMNILFSIDDGYVEQFKVTLYSLYQNSDNPELDVYVLQKQKLAKTVEIQEFCDQLEINYHPIIIGERAFEDAPTTDRYPETIYYRLLAHEYLPETLDKILYLDADILVTNDISPLYDLEINDYLYAAASHVNENGLVDVANKVRLENYQAKTYYNSGTLLMNLKKIRQEVKRQDILDYIRHNDYKLFLPDQDVLNALYGHKIFQVAEEIYNFDTRYFTQYELQSKGYWNLDRVIKETVFLHFCGREKPWLSDNPRGNFFDLYKHYQHLVAKMEC